MKIRIVFVFAHISLKWLPSRAGIKQHWHTDRYCDLLKLISVNPFAAIRLGGPVKCNELLPDGISRLTAPVFRNQQHSLTRARINAQLMNMFLCQELFNCQQANHSAQYKYHSTVVTTQLFMYYKAPTHFIDSCDPLLDYITFWGLW
jgi:hypothetical protein